MSESPKLLMQRLDEIADEHGRIEFRNYSELKRRIDWPLGCRGLKRVIRDLYNDHESGIRFVSASRRKPEQDAKVPEDLHLLVLMPATRVLAKLQEAPVSVPPEEPRSEFLDRHFGVPSCALLIESLARSERVQVVRKPSDRGTVYETLLLA